MRKFRKLSTSYVLLILERPKSLQMNQISIMTLAKPQSTLRKAIKKSFASLRLCER